MSETQAKPLLTARLIVQGFLDEARTTRIMDIEFGIRSPQVESFGFAGRLWRRSPGSNSYFCHVEAIAVDAIVHAFKDAREIAGYPVSTMAYARL
jgi:hypothetical protein